jgi:hypothetical protein
MKQTPNTTGSQLPAKREQRLAIAKRIDEIASGAMQHFNASGFSDEIVIAESMADLRVALTDEMMEPIMSLMNTDLGFRTDRDPKLTPKDGEPNPLYWRRLATSGAIYTLQICSNGVDSTLKVYGPTSQTP